MLSQTSGPQRAIIFYVLTLAMALVIALVATATFGEASPMVTMLTPAIAVVIMLLLTAEGRGGWKSLGVTRVGLKGWWLAIFGPVIILAVSYAVLVALGLATLQAPAISRPTEEIIIGMAASLGVGLIFAF